VHVAAIILAQTIYLTGPLSGTPVEPYTPRRPAWNEHEFHVSLRTGAAYALSAATIMQSTSVAAAFELADFGRHWTLTLVQDIDDRRVGNLATTSLGGGLGFMYAQREGLGVTLDTVLGANWNGVTWDVGVWWRLSVQPLYLPMRDVDRCRGGPALAFVASALSVWTLARVDANQGITVAFGAAIDLMHAAVAPIVQWVREDLRRCAPRRHE
jgi:hypothetical protein